MKVTVEVECTPEEARTFMGLPDVKPMQAAVMANLEQQAVRATQGFSPESALKLWFTTLPEVSVQMQEMFTRLMAGGAKS